MWAHACVLPAECRVPPRGEFVPVEADGARRWSAVAQLSLTPCASDDDQASEWYELMQAVNVGLADLTSERLGQ